MTTTDKIRLFLGAFLFVALCSYFDVKSQGLTNHGTITVSCQQDDIDIDICDRFALFINVNGKLREAEIHGCAVRLPRLDISDGAIVDVTFKYRDMEMRFDSIQVSWIFQRKEMNWNFKTVNPPFNDLALEGMDVSRIYKVNYWQFNPLHEGEGVEIIKPLFFERK